LLPSALAITFLVQWWLMPAGSGVTTTGLALTEVSPSVYGTFTSASALAMNSSLPTSAMP
jgi:hypothetical protein